VTLITSDLGMLSFQCIACACVVELFERRLPVDEREIFAVMLGVALRAVLFVRKLPVQPVRASEFSVDFGVASLAFQNC